MKESDMFPPVIARLPEGFETMPEVRVPMLGRAVDLVADDQNTIVAYEAGLKDWKHHVKQVHELPAMFDLTYVIWRGEPRMTLAETERNLSGANYQVGLVCVDGPRVWIPIEAIRYPLADPSIGRAAFDAARNAGVLPGSPTGSANTPDAAWLKKLVDECKQCPLNIRHIKLIVGPSPFGKSVATMNVIRKKINSGTLPLREQNGELHYGK